MKILIANTSDTQGGAARAANRLHRALNSQDINSTMRVSLKQSDDWRIKGLSRKSRIKREIFLILERLLVQHQHTTNPIHHSPARFSTLKAKHINASEADIVHLHWICDGCLSVKEIARITKPVVWTLHDMWPFCGAEHYASEDDFARWRQSYSKSNRDQAHSGVDIDHWTWRRKLKAWKKPFYIVAPSRWLAECVRNSRLMHDWPITVIPNVLDTQAYKPLSKQIARQVLGFPLEDRLILFGALKGGDDPRKGWDLLQPVLAQLTEQMPNVQGVVFGQSKPQSPPQLGLPLHWMGYLQDDITLALLYSAADVMVVPSRQENLPQSGTEAQACGCPVVAFNITGLPDVVEHRHTGYLAEPYSSDDLIKGIAWVLADQERYKQLCVQARDRAVRLWSPEVVVPQYLEVYRRALESQSNPENE